MVGYLEQTEDWIGSSEREWIESLIERNVTRFFLGGSRVARGADAAQDALPVTSTVRALIGCSWSLLPQIVKFHQVRLNSKHQQ